MSSSRTRYKKARVVVGAARRTRRVNLPKMEERRWVERAPLSVDVRCATPAMAFRGRTLDISRSGIALLRGGAKPLPAGLTLVAELTLPGDAAPIQLLGEVVREWPTAQGLCTAVAFHPAARAASYPVAEFVARQR